MLAVIVWVLYDSLIRRGGIIDLQH